MSTRSAKPLRRLEAFLLDLLTWGTVIYAFEKLIGPGGSGAWFGVVIMMVLNLYLMTRATTLGKYILDMKVIDRVSGEDLTFVRMLLRETIGKLVSGLILMIGFIWIIIDNEAAGWHDKLFRSQVVVLVQKQRRRQGHPDDDEFFVKG